MSAEGDSSTPLQVLYLGSSADVGTLRRTLEARGVVTRARLTPGLAAVVTDDAISGDHPTLRAAATLGVPVLSPSQAIAVLLDVPAMRPQP